MSRNPMNEFRRRVKARLEGPNEDLSDTPDCMYWLKHHEAALVIAAIHYAGRNPEIPPSIAKVHDQIMKKVAQQWNEYDRLEDKIESRIEKIEKRSKES
jgi:hypothetical protein